MDPVKSPPPGRSLPPMTPGNTAISSTQNRMKGNAPMSATTPAIIVNVQDPGSIDRELEQASNVLREQDTSWGLLVTRVDFTTFTVAVSPDVPFGFTRELDLL